MERLAESGDMYAQYLMGSSGRDGPLLIGLGGSTVLVRAGGGSRDIWWHNIPLLSYTSRMIWKCRIPGGSELALHRCGQQQPLRHVPAGQECLKGEHIPKDTAKERWSGLPSGGGGNPFAQYMLGKLYLTWNRAPYDEERAIHG